MGKHLPFQGLARKTFSLSCQKFSGAECRHFGTARKPGLNARAGFQDFGFQIFSLRTFPVKSFRTQRNLAKDAKKIDIAGPRITPGGVKI
jgi:hypothetical protein